MILQALVKLYEDLAAQGKIARPGWSPVQVSWALCLDAGGRLIQVIPLLEGQKNGGSTAQSMELPTPVARSVNIDSNFLWDHSGYLLGIDAKGKPERSRQCFDACRRLHEQVLDGVDSPISRAILAYFSQWQPARAAEHPRSVRLSGGGAKGRQSGLPCGGPFRPGGRRHPRSLAEPL